MKPILAFIQTHAISLACGAVALVALVLTYIFMGDESVKKAMADTLSRTGASSIQSLRASAKNETLINREKALAGSLEKQYQEALAAVRQINRREPLMVGVFPKPERISTPLEFKQTYDVKLRALPKVMQAGSLPSPDEVAEERANVEALMEAEEDKRRELQIGGDRQPAAGGAPVVVTPQTPRRGAFITRGQRGGGEEGEGFGPRGRAGEGGGFGGDLSIVDAGEPKYNAPLRAAVSKAKSIHLYYDPETTLHRSEIADDPGSPSPMAMWNAQVGYWIQSDVVNAIAALHGDLSKKAQGDASVETLPVKRLNSIRVHGYALPGKFIRFGMGSRQSSQTVGQADPAQTPTFTQRTGNEQYDVVRFTVQAVVDQRELFKLVDAIARSNFTVTLSVSYEAVKRDEDERAGYRYGPAPVVLATLDFETYLARDLYSELMPEEVRAALGITAKP